MLFGCASEGADYLDEKELEDNLIEDRADKSTDVNPNEEQQIPVNSELPADIKTFDAEVVSVVDGDTIKVKINGKVESVRFLLVDTPETTIHGSVNNPLAKRQKPLRKRC